MYAKRFFYIFISLLVFSSASFSQPNVDSLKNLLSKSKEKAQLYNQLSEAVRDSSRTKSLEYSKLALDYAIAEKNDEQEGFALSLIGQYYLYTALYDSALIYLKNAYDIFYPLDLYSEISEVLNSIGVVYYHIGEIDSVFHYWDRCIHYNEKSGNIKDNAVTYNNIGTLNHHMGNYSDALFNHEKSLEIKLELNDKRGIAYSYNNIASAYDVLGEYTKAIENFQNSLKYSEKIKDSYLMSVSYNNIASIYKAWNEYDKALEYYQKALNMKQEIDDKKGVANVLNNIGSIYDKKENLDKAFKYYFEAKNAYESIGDKLGLSVSYNNIGGVYYKKRKTAKAIEFHKLSLKISEEVKSHYGISSAYVRLGRDYINLNKYDIAEEYFIKCINYNADYGFTRNKIEAFEELAKLYQIQHRFEEALSSYKKYTELKDSVFNEKKHEQFAQMQTLYESEKKKQEIQKQQLIIENQKIENRRQITVRNFLIAGSASLLALVFLIFAGYKQKMRSNRFIKEQNQLLEQANEEIRAQKDEIEAQHRTVSEQKNFIENQKKKIDDSIKYAQHIQSALMLSEKNAKALLGDFFVIFRPKEIVSGDFYWATRVNDKLIIALADCTGHGISGALMSMLGISFLNEIVRSKKIIEPANILNELRRILIDAFTQNSDADMKREGMSISILSFDTKSMECLWAGARSPLWIIRNDNNKIIEEIIPDKTSVAIHLKMKDFQTHTINLKKGDKLFMFSDGIIDQFGGPDGKKFTKKQFKNILLKSASNSLDRQKADIEHVLNIWQKPNPVEHFDQVDDITVLGVCI
ncbi:MAG: tetratricopeptide repeat protein [Bacteroidota bacterium]